MRIAYFAHVNDGRGSGVIAKIAAQMGSWRKDDHSVGLFIATTDDEEPWQQRLGDVVVGRYGGPLSRLRAMTRLVRAVRRFKPDLVYLRWELFYPPMLWFPRGVPLVVEVNTNDLAESALGRRLRLLYTTRTRSLLLRRADVLIFMTDELSRLPSFAGYRAQHRVISNGIDLAAYPTLPAIADGPPRLAFVGTPAPWHGVDKLEALAALRPDWQFDVVGLNNDGASPPNVTWHGTLERAGVLSVLAGADVGVGTLALHRKAMDEACPLKVREYLAVGLPVLYGYSDPDADGLQPVVLRIANTETNVVDELARIDAFVHASRGVRIPRAAVAHIDVGRKETQRLALFTELGEARSRRNADAPVDGRSRDVAKRRDPRPGAPGRRVLFVTTSMARGGAQRQIVDLAIRLRAAGWEVAVLAMIPPSEHAAELAGGGVELASLDMARGRPTPGALIRYGRFVRSWKPDVIHSHMVHANLLARIGRVFAPRVPVVCTVHSVVEGARWRTVAYRLTDPLATVTTAVSDAAARHSVESGAVPKRRIRSIPNGFDFSRDVPVGARDSIRTEFGVGDAFLWVTAGRLVSAKGYDLLLQAFDAVRRARPSARLVIAGDGPERAALEGLATRLELGGSATLLGDRQDVPSILAAADGFVLSSRWEGLPMVLLEAAAQRLPIVATDVGGNSEIVRPEAGGILVDSTPFAIAGGMLRVMDLSAADRAEIGTALHDVVRAGFDLTAVVERWERLYTAVIDRRSSAGA